MADRLLVGIIDSGCRDDQLSLVRQSRAFGLHGVTEPAQADQMGHGSQVLAIISQQAPLAEFLIARIFTDRLAASVDQVVMAIDWLVDSQVDLINLSLGLRDDRQALAAACRRAVDRGVILCASTPAQGGPVYPAAYPGVYRMTGDARCQPGQFSRLATSNADYGGCVRSALPHLAGASVGCAHMTGHIARYLSTGGAVSDLSGWLDATATYYGPERRRAFSGQGMQA